MSIVDTPRKIAKTIASSISKYTFDQCKYRFQDIESVTICCGGKNDTKDVCEICINEFATPELIRENPGFKQHLAATVCAKMCTCVSNITMNSNIALNRGCDIQQPSDADTQKIINDIRQNLSEQIAGSANVSDKQLSSIITEVVDNHSTVIQQTIYLSQEVCLNGVGTVDVNMDLYLNGLMQAVAKSSTFQQVLNQMLQNEATKLSNEVKKGFTSALKQVWESSKLWIYIGGGVLLAVILAIVILLIIRAYKSGKQSGRGE